MPLTNSTAKGQSHGAAFHVEWFVIFQHPQGFRRIQSSRISGNLFQKEPESEWLQERSGLS